MKPSSKHRVFSRTKRVKTNQGCWVPLLGQQRESSAPASQGLTKSRLPLRHRSRRQQRILQWSRSGRHFVASPALQPSANTLIISRTADSDVVLLPHSRHSKRSRPRSGTEYLRARHSRQPRFSALLPPTTVSVQQHRTAVHRRTSSSRTQSRRSSSRVPSVARRHSAMGRAQQYASVQNLTYPS